MNSPSAPADTSDQVRLLERLRGGESAAFDELIGLAAGRMLILAHRMLPCEADAHDAVQDAFLNAFKSLHRFDGRAKLTTWLHQITVNACLMKLRTARRRPERSIEELLPRYQADGHQTIPSRPWHGEGSLGIEREEQCRLVRDLIEELPDQYRVVLILRDVEGLDTQETANVLGVSADAVKTRLHRAHQALKALLDPYFAEPASETSTTTDSSATCGAAAFSPTPASASASPPKAHSTLTKDSRSPDLASSKPLSAAPRPRHVTPQEPQR